MKSSRGSYISRFDFAIIEKKNKDVKKRDRKKKPPLKVYINSF